MELEALKGALSGTYHSLQPAKPAERKKVGIILVRENIYHIRVLSPAFKKRKEDPSLPQQQSTNHSWQPMRNCHNLKLVLQSTFAQNSPPQFPPET